MVENAVVKPRTELGSWLAVRASPLIWNRVRTGRFQGPDATIG
jgi:hypothetical protein